MQNNLALEEMIPCPACGRMTFRIDECSVCHYRQHNAIPVPVAVASGRENRGWIQTYTGRKMFPLEPTAEMICIEDIAHALSNICRYGGHVKKFYSVAEHSWWVSTIKMRGRGQELQLYGLLHDAGEAYFGDLVRPLKHSGQFEFYRDAEARLERIIFEKYGLAWPAPPEIKQADSEMLCHEIGDPALMAPAHPDHEYIPDRPVIPTGAWCWNPKTAEDQFLRQFRTLTTQII